MSTPHRRSPAFPYKQTEMTSSIISYFASGVKDKKESIKGSLITISNSYKQQDLQSEGSVEKMYEIYDK